MEIIIKGDPKEIAALALELQEPRSRENMDEAGETVNRLLQEKQRRNEPVFQP